MKAMSVVKNWCHTRTFYDKLQYTWTISNFSLCIQNVGECIKSSDFPVDPGLDSPAVAHGSGRLQFRLLLYPRGKSDASKDYISIYLYPVSLDFPEVKTKMKFSFLSAKGEEFHSLHSDNVFSVRDLHGCGFERFFQQEVLMRQENVSQKDTLIVYCEVIVIRESINITDEWYVEVVDPSKCGLSEDLAVLMENHKFSDVTLLAEGCELKAHKNILSARSPVFFAMFEHDMEEQNSNRVEITDMSKEILKEMLQFIYTGKVENIEDNARDLLVAADKYALEGLKDICEKELYVHLTTEDAADTLILADVHNCDWLKTKTVNFIKNHLKEVLATPTWKSMTQSRVPISFHLLSEIFEAQKEQNDESLRPSKRARNRI